jgi:hypothetical protein
MTLEGSQTSPRRQKLREAMSGRPLRYVDNDLAYSFQSDEGLNIG